MTSKGLLSKGDRGDCRWWWQSRWLMSRHRAPGGGGGAGEGGRQRRPQSSPRSKKSPGGKQVLKEGWVGSGQDRTGEARSRREVRRRARTHTPARWAPPQPGTGARTLPSHHRPQRGQAVDSTSRWLGREVAPAEATTCREPSVSSYPTPGDSKELRAHVWSIRDRN